MALADHYEKADILESLSWTAMSEKARIAKLAAGFVREESNIKNRCRRYEGPSLNSINVYVKSLYVAPRGQAKPLNESVLREVIRQKKIREKRRGNRPWVWPAMPAKGNGYAYNSAMQDRRNAVAATKYKVGGGDYTLTPNCTALTRIGDYLILIDSRDYNKAARIYFERGKMRRVVVLKHDPSAQDKPTMVLLSLASRQVHAALLMGGRITLNVEREGFDVDGVLHPWVEVRKVYGNDTGALVETDARPTR